MANVRQRLVDEMERGAWVLALGLAVIPLGACGADSRGERDAASDAPAHDAGIDATSGDAGVCAQWQDFCALFGCPEWAICEAAVALDPDATLAQQDTTSGGHGECAPSASGVGGPSLYYAVSIPPGRYLNVLATPASLDELALVRVLYDCRATASVASDNGSGGTLGRAALCLRNPGSTDRRIVLAVSRYSGEIGDLPLAFDLALHGHASIDECVGPYFSL